MHSDDLHSGAKGGNALPLNKEHGGTMPLQLTDKQKHRPKPTPPVRVPLVPPVPSVPLVPFVPPSRPQKDPMKSTLVTPCPPIPPNVYRAFSSCNTLVTPCVTPWTPLSTNVYAVCNTVTPCLGVCHPPPYENRASHCQRPTRDL